MKPLKTAYEKVESFAKESKDKGLNLLKKAGFGALVLATLASCQKDDVEPMAENQNPKVEANLDKVDSTSADVFVNFEDVDGEVVSGTYYLTRFNPVAKIMGDTPFTAEQIKAGNLDGFNLNLKDLKSDTNYKLVIEAVTDNEGAEAQTVEIEFKTEKDNETQESVYTYTVETNLISQFTEWNDKIDGNKIPAGTVVAIIDTDVDVKKDGITDNSVPTELGHLIEGIDANLLEIVGNVVQFANDTYVDNPNTGVTESWVTGGLDYTIKTVLKKDGQEKAQDLDSKNINFIDAQDMYWFKDQAGNPVYIENTNGQKYQDAIDARNLYNTQTGGVSLNAGSLNLFAGGSNKFAYTEPVVDGETYPSVQIMDGGIHDEKYVAMQQQEKISKVIDTKGVEHSVYYTSTNNPDAIQGTAAGQVPDENWVTNTSTSVKVDQENAEKLAEHGVLAWYEKNGITPQ